MFIVRCLTLTAVGLLASTPLHAGVFADSLIDYAPGTGVTENYTDPASALGEPARVTPGMFGGPVDPFAPPYLNSQLVSLGEGGSLTVGFGQPIVNLPSNPFGMDFLIFGNTGFWVTNAMDENFNFIGAPTTDGALLGNNVGATRVSVSADDLNWYALDPSPAPKVDELFPTDGAGDFTQPVNPAYSQTDFVGLSLEEIRALYAGSGGGAGFDIGWAVDGDGNPVTLDSVNYVRVEVLSGKSDIDALVIVPEPSTWALLGVAALAWTGWWRKHKGSALQLDD